MFKIVQKYLGNCYFMHIHRYVSNQRQYTVITAHDENSILA